MINYLNYMKNSYSLKSKENQMNYYGFNYNNNNNNFINNNNNYNNNNNTFYNYIKKKNDIENKQKKLFWFMTKILKDFQNLM